MCAKKEEEGDCSGAMNNIQDYQNNLQQQQQPTSSDIFGTSNNAGFMSIFPQDSVLPWPPPIQPFNPIRESDPFFLPPPPPPASFYGSFFNRSRFGYDGFGATSAHTHHHHHQHQHEHLRILSEALGPVVQAGSGHPFGFQGELGKMTAQEIMDAKALAASKSHSEAERRRRERINNHLAKLRSILPNTTKTDKASLLAEVIQHVKELKRQTSQISETNTVPTETDEITVDVTEEDVEEHNQDGKFIIKASICCDDRSDLLPDLIKTLKALRLKTLKAEITTVGCRVKNVLFVTGEESMAGDEQQHCIGSIQEALRAVMDKSSMEESSASGNAKRQRMSNNNSLSIVEPQQQHQQR